MIIEGDDFDSRDFRRDVWRQTTTAVALLTSAHGGRADVMACEWAMAVSIAPMQFIVSVSPRHVTHELLESAGEFGLSFCSDAQANLAHVSGSNSLRDVDKWQLADFETYEAKRIGAPMISGCILNVECRLAAAYPLGSHTLFVGEALWAKYDPDLEPLLYRGGKYWRLGEHVPKG